MKNALWRQLPSCTVDVALLRRIERHLFNVVPKLLRSELQRMMRVLGLDSPASLKSYRILIEDKNGVREFESAAQVQAADFTPTVKAVRIELEIGQPEVLSLRIAFSHRDVPGLKIFWLSKEAREQAPDIAAGLEEIVGHWANGNSQFYRRPFQILVATLLPVSLTAAGLWWGADPFLLFTAQGWVLLLCLLQASLLPRLYPLVTFAGPKRFNLRRYSLMSVFCLNASAIVGYTGLLAINLGLVALPAF